MITTSKGLKYNKVTYMINTILKIFLNNARNYVGLKATFQIE